MWVFNARDSYHTHSYAAANNFWGLFRLYWTELRDRKGGRDLRGGGGGLA